MCKILDRSDEIPRSSMYLKIECLEVIQKLAFYANEKILLLTQSIRRVLTRTWKRLGLNPSERAENRFSKSHFSTKNMKISKNHNTFALRVNDFKKNDYVALNFVVIHTKFQLICINSWFKKKHFLRHMQKRCLGKKLITPWLKSHILDHTPHLL